MKIDFSDKRIVIVAAVIVALLAINIFLLLQPTKGNDPVSLYKDFASQNHASMQEMRNSLAQNASAIDTATDLNAQEKALLKDFQSSFLADLDWLIEKENPVYFEMAATQSPLRANELMKKEMSIMVVANYVFGINEDAANDALAGLLSKQEAIEEAELSLDWIEVIDLLNDSTAQDLVSQTVVTKQELIEYSKELMQEYLEKRKTAFSLANGNTNEKLVEAFKLLELDYLLQLNAFSDTNDSI